MKTLILFACSVALASADTIVNTETDCTVFDTVSNPTTCNLTEGIGGWSSTAGATVTVDDPPAPGSNSFALSTFAGPYGDSETAGGAVLSMTFGGAYVVEIGAAAMGGDGGLSNVYVQIGNQSWTIGDYEDLDFSIDTTPGEGLLATVATEGEGYANLDIDESGLVPVSTPEPGAGMLALFGLALCGVRRFCPGGR
jgi:hypothetical protein